MAEALFLAVVMAELKHEGLSSRTPIPGHLCGISASRVSAAGDDALPES